ncbi:MAG TPA: hypothetical protein VGH13_21580 [Xanthobacteraceae bacterium]
MIAGAALMAGLASAHAQVAYDNSVLNGCYAVKSTSVGGSIDRALVGTICFNGKGRVKQTTLGPPFLTGALANTGGDVRTNQDVGDKYDVQNRPGDGMGTVRGQCARLDFSIADVENGIARKFYYVLGNIKNGCAVQGNPRVTSGEGTYQGPLH